MSCIYRISSAILAFILEDQPWRFPSWVSLLSSLGSHLGNQQCSFPSLRGFLSMLNFHVGVFVFPCSEGFQKCGSMLILLLNCKLIIWIFIIYLSNKAATLRLSTNFSISFIFSCKNSTNTLNSTYYDLNSPHSVIICKRNYFNDFNIQ